MNIEEIHTAVIHCSATKPNQDWGFKEIDKLHRKKGWDGCGYHWIIKRGGVIEPGRPMNVQGAHVKYHNENTLGICLIGGINYKGKAANNFTDGQWSSLDLLLRGIRDKIPNIEFSGHRDFSPDKNGDGVIDRNDWMKDCPCFSVDRKLYEMGISSHYTGGSF